MSILIKATTQYENAPACKRWYRFPLQELSVADILISLRLVMLMCIDKDLRVD